MEITSRNSNPLHDEKLEKNSQKYVAYGRGGKNCKK